jgi:hypothetical protein
MHQKALDVEQIANDASRLISETLEQVSTIVLGLKGQLLEELDESPQTFCRASPEAVTIVGTTFNQRQMVVSALQDFQEFRIDEITTVLDNVGTPAGTLLDKTDRVDTQAGNLGWAWFHDCNCPGLVRCRVARIRVVS